ncbi:universal stress protein [Lacinutrix neustonica]|uniref:Universal stress protein n=1 Tax=Lacinutrix neustonica TaxID=2980107 RepID=A0A9E8SEY4_9FLAO|nr:universal stress protein [Lacinutrix neustonica]WAC02794.1 universal stress protein [Lacinutrix neustonica]
MRISEAFPNNKNHTFYTLTDYNFFIESIRKHVEEKKIDLIIMSTKGASSIQRHIVGTNTGDIITKVHCTTLVVPENAKFTSLEEIAFPTDFLQFYGVKTLIPLTDILERHESALKILHISKKEFQLNNDQQKNKEFLDDYFNSHHHSFHFLTNKRVESAVQCFVESRGISMIAMVAKNLNYFQQILFHTRVEEISYQTEIPFLVLHE